MNACIGVCSRAPFRAGQVRLNRDRPKSVMSQPPLLSLLRMFTAVLMLGCDDFVVFSIPRR
jgi:hypothetical protein